ncbi:NUDIX domain-containing protein [Jiella sp. MQZ9-1]|uniref:NUDIX domain-containing protein n=1 Tax=Jiella flava TaxID=2816857 RepID=A0A939FZ75_9HYPH|nr:NUDIX domain-containing protein [Jiella flava]MBO0662054.1 NUDIX domain-containing protein [Jiella flava]MCD2470619.1 NUDIX domain-containing protein [Jiella flava]
MTGEIAVAAVVLMREDGQTLLVRKRGTTRFMQPGGKPEEGETCRQAAEREVFEEIGLQLDSAQLTDHGVFHDHAATEAGMTVVAHVFSAWCDQPIAVAAEIDAAVWVDPTASARQSESIFGKARCVDSKGESDLSASDRTQGARRPSST